MRIASLFVLVAGCTSGGPGGFVASGDLATRLGDGGTNPDSATCGPCGWGQRCVAGKCALVDVLGVHLSAHAAQKVDGSVTFSFGQAFGSASRYLGGKTFAPGKELGREGPCVARDDATVNGEDYQGFAGDAGTITATGGSTDPITLTLDVMKERYASDLDPQAPSFFIAGKPMTVRAIGGADFPAFDASVVQPSEMTIATGEVRRGEPLVVRWTGDAAKGTMMMFFVRVTDTNGHHVDVTCDPVPDTGEHTVPASLTKHFSPLGDSAFIRGERSSHAHLEPASKGVAIEVHATAGATRTAAYAP